MKLTSTKVKVITAIALILIALLFAHSQRPERSQQQNDFDSWLSVKEQTLSEIASDSKSARATSALGGTSPLPTLSLKMALPESGEVRSYVLGSRSTPEQSSKILRLLQLMREADIFSEGSTSGNSDSSGITISIKDGTVSFQSSLPPKTVQSNLKTMLLLRLFKEFAEQNQESVPANA